MKKLIILMLILLVGKFSFGQYPINQSIGSDSTLVTSKGGLKGRIVVYSYADTTAANLERIKQYAGAIIFTTVANKLWYRNAAASSWVELGSSAGGVNIYNSDGSLTGDRQLDGAGYYLRLNDLNEFGVGADSVSINVTGGIGFLLNDTGRFTKRVSYTSNLGSTFTRHTLVDKNYVDSLQNIIPTLQQVLTAGSTLTSPNGIIGGGYDFDWDGMGDYSIVSDSSISLTANSIVGIQGQGSILILRTDSITANEKIVYTSNINGSLTTPNSLVTRSLVDSLISVGGGGGSSVTLIPQDSVYNQNTFSEQSSWINANIFQPQTSSFFAGGYRDGGSALTVSGPSGDSIYFYGGWTTPSTVYDSVYYSLDGGITKTYVGLAPWGAMHSFAMFKADNGYYYKIGGDYLSTNAQKLGVWRTTTPGVMASWTQVGTLPSRGRILFDAIELNGTLYTGGGQYTTNWSDGATDTIWKSVDNGVTWSYHSSGSGYFDKNISHTWVKRGGRVYQVAGGQYDEATPGNRTYDKTVISTDDFITYRVEESIPSAGVQYPSVVLWDSKIWCMAGYNGTANVNSVNYLDKGGRWHVAANYDSAGTALTATHAAAITAWKDRIVLMNGNDFNKTYWVNRSRFITGEARPKFITTPVVDSLLSESNLFIGSTYSGSPVSYIKINPVITGGQIELQKKTLIDNHLILGSTAAASNYINFRNSNDALGYLEYANTGFDIYWNNNMYWRLMNDGTMRFKEIASGGTPASTYGSVYVKTDNNLYFKNDAGTEFQISGAGSSGITVGTTTITGGTTTNIPYNSSGVYQESTNMQWDNTNQLIQTGRGFRVKSGYTFLTETSSSLSTILGNSVKRSATANEVEKTSADPGSYVRLNYQNGITFNTNFTGAVGTSVAETSNEAMRIDLNRRVGIGVTSPSAILHLKAGTATASTAPLKFTSGTNLTTAEAGAMEYDGTNLFFTRSGTTRETFTFNDGTQTLTNKRITKRVGTTASSSSLTISGDDVDMYTVTALAADITINAPSGTPTQGQTLLIRLKDNGTGRLITWNAIFRAIGVTLPATTTANKTMYIGCVYNTTDSKWDVVSVNEEV